MKRTKREKLILVLSLLTLLLIVKGIIDLFTLRQRTDLLTQLLAIAQYFGFIAMIVVPDLIERRMHFHIPDHVYISVAFFAFLALICGNGLHFYRLFPWWDTAEHLVSGVSLGFIGYWLVEVISDHSSKHTFLKAVVAILMALGCGAVWEMCEYTSDGIQGTNFQRYMKTGRSVLKKGDQPRIGRDALYDTMKDIFVDFGGASAGVVIVLVYKYKKSD
ncbi:MAG TPA: hypothetical protein DCQ45_04670 [Erysipelotrichaceae bacterium]|nr:hypothetical protein [Erysipelotrichaceae bacterium]